MGQQDSNEHSEARNGALGRGLADCLMGAPVFAWLFAAFLSGAFYQGSDSVSRATVFAAAAAVTAMAALPAASTLLQRHGSARAKVLLPAIGLGVLAAVSGLVALGAVPWPAMAFSIGLGVATGFGLACVIASTIEWAAGQSLSSCLVVLAAAYAAGVLLFLGLMVWVERFWLPIATAALPLAALGLLAVRARRAAPPSSSCFANSIRRGQLRSMVEPSSFARFAAVSGLLLGYCYNVYPKSTRFAGIHAEALFGLVTPAVVIFLIASFAGAVLVALVARMARGKTAYVLGCLLLVTLAGLYFCLPMMPMSPLVYVLLNCVACYAEAFVFCGLVFRWSRGAYDAFRSCLLRQTAGVAIGTVVGALFIELTTPSPLVSMPVVLRDFLFVGLPTVGFIVLALLLFRLAQDAVFPPAPAKPEAVGLSDLAQATGEIVRRFALTPREGEILGMLLQGRSGPYIAEDLYLSKSTVKTHIRHIYDKLGISSRQQLIDIAHDICQSLGGASSSR